MSYLIDEMLRVFALAREQLPALRMRILNRDDRDLILTSARRLDVDLDSFEVHGVDFDEMPQALSDAHVGIALLMPVRSKQASSPIKVTEYLACGLPVVINAGLGDLESQVRDYAAGHVVEGYRESDLRLAASAIARLVSDEQARRNARRLAEDVYALPSAVARYAAVYERIRRDRGAPDGTLVA